MGLGILIGGILVEYAGYSVAFWFTAISQTSGAVLLYFFTRRFFHARRLS